MVEMMTKSKPEVKFQYSGTFERIQRHVIPDPRATLQRELIPSAILKIVFAVFHFFRNAVWALPSGGLGIVFDM